MIRLWLAAHVVALAAWLLADRPVDQSWIPGRTVPANALFLE